MTLPQDVEKLQSSMRDAVRAHWKSFLFEGILLAVLGLAAIILPPLASLAVTIFLGWMFLISGIGGLIATFWARKMPGFWWSLISAALAVLAGMVLLARPVESVLTLTIVVGAYFLAEGVATIMYALEHRRELSDRWSWLLGAGLMDILTLHRHRRTARLGGTGDRAPGGCQSIVRRRHPDRHGACGPEYMTPIF
jgi:uncharacterized membrane protein HdeD (DUF308 family)